LVESIDGVMLQEVDAVGEVMLIDLRGDGEGESLSGTQRPVVLDRQAGRGDLAQHQLLKSLGLPPVDGPMPDADVLPAGQQIEDSKTHSRHSYTGDEADRQIQPTPAISVPAHGIPLF
jgi:hypothetical protein